MLVGEELSISRRHQTDDCLGRIQTTCSRESKMSNTERDIARIDVLKQDCEVNERKPILGNSAFAENDCNSRNNIWKHTNWRQKSMVLYVSIVNYLNFLCNGAASPFLARVVLQKGGTVVLSTLVLQVSMITMAIFSIVLAKYQTRIGCKMLIISGQIFFALSQISFGVLGYFRNHWALVAVGTFLRAVQGICQAALGVAGLTILCQELPHHISTVFGIFEAAYGAGYLTGPYLGGFLYDWSGGMMVPMAATGLLSLLFSIVGFVMLKQSEKWKSDSSDCHIMKILSQPIAVFIIGAAGTAVGGFSLCDATITVYLKSLGFSVTKVGQLLFLMGTSYCLCSVLVGFVINKRKNVRRLVLSIGFVGGLAFPLVFTPNQSDLCIYVAAFGFGMCTSVAFIPSFDELRLAIGLDPDDDPSSTGNLSLNSSLSGLWSASASISCFIVPLVGSAIETTLPFYISFIASLLIGYGAVVILTLISCLYHHAMK